MEFDYDLFVIGAGSGGVRLSRVAASYGARVGIAEEERIGGTCVLRGCIPKKLLVYASHYGHDVEDAAGFGWTFDIGLFSWPALIEAKDREIARLSGIYGDLLNKSGVEIHAGRATLVDAHTVDVAGRRITARHIGVATGSRPVLPPIPGIEHAITSREALDLPELPRRIAIVGGGYIAVEFAGIFNGLGADVDLFYRGAQILRGFDDDVRRALHGEMTKHGIAIHTHAGIDAIERGADGALTLRLAQGAYGPYDAVLYATGRVATRDGMLLAANLFGGKRIAADHRYIPSAVFSQPEIATVGLTEADARAELGALDIYKTSFRALRHTLSGRDEKTFMKLVVARDSQRVVGAHMVGRDAAEIIQGIAIAIRAGATKAQFDETVGIHPTAAEEFVTLRQKEPDDA